MPNNGEPMMTMKTQIAVESMQFYVQQIMTDHFDEIKEKIQAEVKRQFETINLEEVIDEAMEDIVKNAISSDVKAAWQQAWWNNKANGIRGKVRQVLADHIAETLADNTFDG